MAKAKALTWLVPVIILIFTIAFISGCTPKEKGGEVKVGAILPLTGWGAYWGQPVQKGMLLALKEINDSSFKVIFEDTKSDNKEAVTAAHKLLDVDGVDALHVEFSGASNAVSPIALANEKVMVYDTFSKTPLKDNPFTFKMYFDAYTECRKLAKIALKNGVEKIGLLMPLLDLSEDCINGTKSIYDAVVIENFDVSANDLKTQLLKLKEAGAGAIIMLGYEDNFLLAFKQKTDLGLNIPIYCGGKDDCMTTKIINKVGNGVNGSFVFDMVLNPDFIEKLKKAYPNVADSELKPAATGYDAVYFLYSAFKKCSRKDTICIREALIDDNYQGAIKTTMGFKPNRILSIDTEILKFENNQFVPYEE